MQYVRESAARRLRRELGLGAVSASKRVRTDDWYGLNTGDIVREKDGRHWGRVEGWSGWTVTIKWLDSGHFSHVPRDTITDKEQD